MTAGRIRVRVRDRSAEAPWGSGPTSPVIRTVEISATCPRCGGPRGEPRNLNQVDDGAHYSVDVWANPCGHADPYTAVVEEARQLAAAVTRRNRVLARYAGVLIAAHGRGEITAEEVYRRGMAAGRRVLARYTPEDLPAGLTVDDVQLRTRRQLPRTVDGELEEPTPADEEGWDARDDWQRGGHA